MVIIIKKKKLKQILLHSHTLGHTHWFYDVYCEPQNTIVVQGSTSS